MDDDPNFIFDKLLTAGQDQLEVSLQHWNKAKLSFESLTDYLTSSLGNIDWNELEFHLKFMILGESSAKELLIRNMTWTRQERHSPQYQTFLLLHSILVQIHGDNGRTARCDQNVICFISLLI